MSKLIFTKNVNVLILETIKDWVDFQKKIENKYVPGQLNYRFTDCVFDIDIRITEANIIEFKKCTFNKEFSICGTHKKTVNFQECIFKEEVSFNDTTFENKVRMQSVVFEEKVFFDNTKFNDLCDFWNTSFKMVTIFYKTDF